MNSVLEHQPHKPVMVAEVLELLAVKAGDTVVDATAGAGGHLRLLAEAVGPTGRIFGVDQDDRAHQSDAAGGVADDFPATLKLLRGQFSEIPELFDDLGVDGVDVFLCDLGVSSMQLDEPERGFSFRHDGPLDMRMDDRGMTAREFLTHSSVEEIADVLFHYGEERRSRQIARAIKSVQPLPDSTAFLAKTVIQATGGQRGRIHPATRTFQAIRIAVNRELDELDRILEALPGILRPGARAAFISFHSLEDRKVKKCFQKGARETNGEGPFWNLLTKKPLVATKQESAKNPRSRSAKLRAVERIKC